MMFNPLLQAYIECALWASTDESTPEGGEPMDANYSASDLAPETLAEMASDCAEFERDNEADIGCQWEQAGHDLWLTRNGHGVGFWDRDDNTYGTPEARARLNAAAKAMGARTLYVGDDGLIYQMGG